MKKEDEAKRKLEEKERFKKLQEEEKTKNLGIAESTVVESSTNTEINYQYFETKD